MKNTDFLNKLTLGTCYYPEHWDKSLWDDDLKRMKEHGIEVIRIAEFAWNKFEPSEDVFTFDFFDEFLEAAKKADMKVILCTPTATPPAWLTHKYPEVLNADINGVLYRHGMRKHHNHTSPKYLERVAILVDKIAEHYSHYENIVGWQIDNEINCETAVYYSEADHIAFREYLKNKYKTLDNLNEKLGMVFWNQTYTSWEEIHLPRTNIKNSHNPHLCLEEKKFISYSAINYIRLQADIINKYKAPHQFITTNGMFPNIDNHKLVNEILDFMTYDNYPNFSFDLLSGERKDGEFRDRDASMNLIKTRGASPSFGIMEQQSGPGGWDTRMHQPAPKPGQMRLWTIQAIAQGANFISYFRWRTCCVGTEIYWHGLNDYSNQPNRRLEELKIVKSDIEKLNCVYSAGNTAVVAVLKDYNNEWDGESDVWHGPLDDYSTYSWFKALEIEHVPFDIVYVDGLCDAALSKYDAVVYPHPTIVTPKASKLLSDYVKEGGKLIIGCRAGYKDEYGRCPMHKMPGLLSDLCGTEVVDYTFIGPYDDAQYAVWDDTVISAPVFNDILKEIRNAEVLATFKGNYYDGMPALVKNAFGKGEAYYFGAGFDLDTAQTFINKLNIKSPLDNVLVIPKEAELVIRSDEHTHYAFVLNYMPREVEIEVLNPCYDIISEITLNGHHKIDKYGFVVLAIPK